MSGTSLDGIDIAIVDITDDNACQLITAKTFAFPEHLLETLHHVISEQHCSFEQLGSLNIELGQLIAQYINTLLQETTLSAGTISAIGCHGHTLFHSPDSQYPFSMQIGDAHTIAELTTIRTIADFRQRDIASSGQGAPLVPAFHAYAFSSQTESRAVINIGGISNISYLPSNNNEAIIGFDSGPGNTLLDAWIKQHQNRSYDEDGQWAAQGQVNMELLEQCLNDPYFAQAVPKSTGREYFNLSWLDKQLSIFEHTLSAQDVQATLLHLTAQVIAKDIQYHCPTVSSVFICGGGSHNKTLFNLLASLLPEQIVTTTEVLGIHPDWVEACAFAWLAYRTSNNKPGNIPSVTGASHPVVLGAIYSSSNNS